MSYTTTNSRFSAKGILTEKRLLFIVITDYKRITPQRRFLVLSTARPSPHDGSAETYRQAGL